MRSTLPTFPPAPITVRATPQARTISSVNLRRHYLLQDVGPDADDFSTRATLRQIPVEPKSGERVARSLDEELDLAFGVSADETTEMAEEMVTQLRARTR